MSTTPERSAMRVDTPPTMTTREGAFPSAPGSPSNEVFINISSQEYYEELLTLNDDLDDIKGLIAYYKQYKSFIPPYAPAASLIESINENIIDICGNDTKSKAPPTRLTFSDGAGGGKSKKRKSKKRKSKKRKTKKRRRKTRY